MSYEMIEAVQIVLFVVCIVGLFFVILRSERADKQDINEFYKDKLRNARPETVEEVIVKEIKKERWVTVFFAFVLTEVATAVLGVEWLVLVGVFLIIVWIIYDVVKTRRGDDKVLIPAYVQSTFKWRLQKSAQLIYYDYKRDKFRLKRMSVNRYEKKTGIIRRGHVVYIIAVENRNSVKCIGLLERSRQKNCTDEMRVSGIMDESVR